MSQCSQRNVIEAKGVSTCWEHHVQRLRAGGKPACSWKKRGKQGEVILGDPLAVPVKALAFACSRIDGNLERVKQEADMV